MAAPHVAGAWALMRQAAPGAGVTDVLNALRQTGLPITDTRFLGTVTVPRVRLFRALATFVPVTHPSPAVMSVSPSHVPAGKAATLTITGTGFDGFSVFYWNGAARPTTVISTTQVRGFISAADVAVPGTALVSVVNPSPGGGISGSLPVVIDPPPTLSVSAATVAPGSPVDRHPDQRPGRIDRLAGAGRGGVARHELPEVDLRRRGIEHEDVDGHHAGHRGRVPVPPLPEQRVGAGGDESDGDGRPNLVPPPPSLSASATTARPARTSRRR